jgi:hypothetical protein
MRRYRRHRARTQNRSLPTPTQIALPLESPQSGSASRSRSPSRWIDRPARLSPSRPATRRAKRAPLCIAPVSSFLDNIKEKVRQRHPFWLTSSLSAIMVGVIQNGWRQDGSTLPTFNSSADPELGSGRSHVERGSGGGLPSKSDSTDLASFRLRMPLRAIASSRPPSSALRTISGNS